jgi:hypothetical protein
VEEVHRPRFRGVHDDRGAAAARHEKLELRMERRHASPVPPGHDTNGKPVPVYVYPEKAAGGLFSTVGDIAAFVTAGMARFSHARHGCFPHGVSPSFIRPGGNTRPLRARLRRVRLRALYRALPDGKQAVSHGGQGPAG